MLNKNKIVNYWERRYNSITKLLEYLSEISLLEEHHFDNVMDRECGWGGSTLTLALYAHYNNIPAGIMGMDNYVHNIENTGIITKLVNDNLIFNNNVEFKFIPYENQELSETNLCSMITHFSSMMKLKQNGLFSFSEPFLKENSIIIYTTILNDAYHNLKNELNKDKVDYFLINTDKLRLDEWDANCIIISKD